MSTQSLNDTLGAAFLGVYHIPAQLFCHVNADAFKGTVAASW